MQNSRKYSVFHYFLINILVYCLYSVCSVVMEIINIWKIIPKWFVGELLWLFKTDLQQQQAREQSSLVGTAEEKSVCESFLSIATVQYMTATTTLREINYISRFALFSSIPLSIQRTENKLIKILLQG